MAVRMTEEQYEQLLKDMKEDKPEETLDFAQVSVQINLEEQAAPPKPPAKAPITQYTGSMDEAMLIWSGEFDCLEFPVGKREAVKPKRLEFFGGGCFLLFLAVMACSFSVFVCELITPDNLARIF